MRPGRQPQRSDGQLQDVAQAAAVAAREALAATTDQLEALRRAGVVDAGGRGYVVLSDALLEVVSGVHRDLPEFARLAPEPDSLSGPEDTLHGYGGPGVRGDVPARRARRRGARVARAPGVARRLAGGRGRRSAVERPRARRRRRCGGRGRDRDRAAAPHPDHLPGRRRRLRGGPPTHRPRARGRHARPGGRRPAGGQRGHRGAQPPSWAGRRWPRCSRGSGPRAPARWCCCPATRTRGLSRSPRRWPRATAVTGSR